MIYGLSILLDMLPYIARGRLSWANYLRAALIDQLKFATSCGSCSTLASPHAATLCCTDGNIVVYPRLWKWLKHCGAAFAVCYLWLWLGVVRGSEGQPGQAG